MLYHALNGFSGRPQIFARVEVSRIFSQIFADFRCHGQTKVSIDIDLADAIFGSFPDHFFRNTLCTGHVTTILVALVHEFLQYGRSTVEYQRCIRQQAVNGLQTLEIQIRFSLKFICTMAGSNGNGQRIHTGSFYEFHCLIRIGEGCGAGVHIDCVFHTGQSSQFRFHHNTVGMSIFHNLSGDADVLFKRMLGTIDHDRRKSVVHTFLADIEIFAVVQMKGDIQSRIQDGCFHQLQKICRLGIFAGSGRHLQDQGRALLDGSVDDALNDFHIVNIKRTDGIIGFQCLGEHFFRCD